MAERCEQRIHGERADNQPRADAEQQADREAERVLNQQDERDMPPFESEDGIQRQLAAAVFEQIAVNIHEKRHEHDRHQIIPHAHHQLDVAAVRDGLCKGIVVHKRGDQEIHQHQKTGCEHKRQIQPPAAVQPAQRKAGKQTATQGGHLPAAKRSCGRQDADKSPCGTGCRAPPRPRSGRRVKTARGRHGWPRPGCA